MKKSLCATCKRRKFTDEEKQYILDNPLKRCNKCDMRIHLQELKEDWKNQQQEAFKSVFNLAQHHQLRGRA